MRLTGAAQRAGLSEASRIGGVITASAMLWVLAQPALDYGNPGALLTLGILLIFVVLCGYEIFVLRSRRRLYRAVFLASLTASAAVAVMCMVQIDNSQALVERACSNIQRRLLARADEADAETFQALKCRPRVPITAFAFASCDGAPLHHYAQRHSAMRRCFPRNVRHPSWRSASAPHVGPVRVLRQADANCQPR